MSTLIVSVSSSDGLRIAAEVLRAGEVVAFPTDTVYGLGVLLGDRVGISRIYALKGREADKALPVLIGDLDELARVVASVPPGAERLIARFWPGALTLVLPRHPAVPVEVAPGKASLGVRFPAHAGTLALLQAAQSPLASSSANRSGESPARDAAAVAAAFPTGLGVILDGGPVASGLPSTVLDFTAPEKPMLLREGAITRAALEAALGEVIATRHG